MHSMTSSFNQGVPGNQAGGHTGRSLGSGCMLLVVLFINVHPTQHMFDAFDSRCYSVQVVVNTDNGVVSGRGTPGWFAYFITRQCS